MSIEVSTKPISYIRDMLVERFGADWHDLEDETISLELGIVFDEILLQKIKFLKVMEDDAERFYEDPLFFLHSCDIINNVPVDPDTAPMPTSLEVAYALEEVSKMFPYEDTISPELKKVVTYMLQQEGYSSAPYPFSFVDPMDLAPGDTEEEKRNKARAILAYIRYMGEQQ